MNRKIEWMRLARDVLLVMVLGSFGTLAASAFIGGVAQFVAALLMLAVGFCISGVLAGEGRFRHLAIVALGVWLVRLVLGLVAQDPPLPGLLAAIVSIYAAMGVGGVASLAVSRWRARASPSQT